jgi:hypothetical protein
MYWHPMHVSGGSVPGWQEAQNHCSELDREALLAHAMLPTQCMCVDCWNYGLARVLDG